MSGDFSILQRIEAIEDREVDLLVNLVTLSRLRKLNFFQTPIRVSLNAVALDLTPPHVLAVARAVLSGRVPPDLREIPFDVIAIVGEVGEAHVSRLRAQSPCVAEPRIKFNTLDQSRLASSLLSEWSAASKPPILISDEVTALGVVKQLRGKGKLLFPISTDTSARSPERRQIPAHVLGIGYRRPHGGMDERRVDEDDGTLYEDILTTYLAHEHEMTASSYQGLYKQLVSFVASCLDQSSELWLSDLRRVSRNVLDRNNDDVRSIIERMARRYARRCLQINQRAADQYREQSPWTPVLRRARERISQAEFARRGAIRSTLRLALNLAAGLRTRAASLSRQQFQRALRYNGERLSFILEREFENRLPDAKAFFHAHMDDSFETFLSAFQLELHLRSRESRIYDVLSENESPEEFREIAKPYNEELSKRPQTTADSFRFRHRSAVPAKDLRGYFVRTLDEPVGVMWVAKSKGRLELIDLYVTEHRRSSQIGLLILQNAIHVADKQNLESVDLLLDSVPNARLIQWFETMGFQKHDTVLRYTLFKFK